MEQGITFKAWAICHNIRQKEIADVLHISLQSVNNKMNGRQDFSLAQIKALHRAYGVSADIFLN